MSSEHAALAPESPSRGADLYVPAEWTAPTSRDVPLDLLRGLAMVVILLNHTKLDPGLGHLTRNVLSAAEVLVGVSGVIMGMVFGRRWLADGGRATTLMLLRRARKLYLASVVVVGLVGVATLVPFLGTDALAISPNAAQPVDSYAHDGLWRSLLAIVTLEAGPWQFNILGFFIAVLVLAPLLLAALARGWWPLVLIASVAVYLVGREFRGDVLPSQSERAFPLLIWQLLFVGGLLVGWHRRQIALSCTRRRRSLTVLICGLAAASLALQIGGATLVDPTTWEAFRAEHFHKGTLDPLRLLAMTSIALAAYLGLRRTEPLLAPVLLPLGRNSFYVFIVHVFLCLALASVPVLAGDDALGFAGNVALQLACVAVMVALVRRRVLFRWIPR